MDYDKFILHIKDRVKNSSLDISNVSIMKLLKNNDVELDALIITNSNNSISPAIYLDVYYEKYKNGMNLNEITTQILSTYYMYKDPFSITKESLDDFNLIKDKIVYKIINYEKNKNQLKNYST